MLAMRGLDGCGRRGGSVGGGVEVVVVGKGELHERAVVGRRTVGDGEGGGPGVVAVEDGDGA